MIRLSGSIPIRDKVFNLLHIGQTGCREQQAPYSIDKISSVLPAKSGCSVKLTTNSCLVQNLRTTKSTPPVSYKSSCCARRQTSSLFIHTYIHTYIHAHITFLLPHSSLNTIHLYRILPPAAFVNICTRNNHPSHKFGTC